MTLKGKPIKIYITSAGFIPPQLEYPSFGELENISVWKMYGGGMFGYYNRKGYICSVYKNSYF